MRCSLSGRSLPALGGQSVSAGEDTPPGPAASPAAAGTGQDGVQGDVGGDVADLLQLIHGSKVVELRTTCNGSYGASLFFWPDERVW